MCLFVVVVVVVVLVLVVVVVVVTVGVAVVLLYFVLLFLMRNKLCTVKETGDFNILGKAGFVNSLNLRDFETCVSKHTPR